MDIILSVNVGHMLPVISSLIDAGLITTNDGPLKILGDGELTVPLTVKAAAFTAGARNKIEAAGGSCEVIEA